MRCITSTPRNLKPPIHADKRRFRSWFYLRSFAVICGSIFWVAVSIAAQIPTPEQAFGFRPGADYKLADYRMIVDYYRKLAAAAPDRVRLQEIGPTAEDQQMILAIISSSEKMPRLDSYRDISRRLAMVRGLNDEQARDLARRGKPLFGLTAGCTRAKWPTSSILPSWPTR